MRSLQTALMCGAGALLLSGCVGGGPTYGTDKSATEQLFEDLGTATSLRRADEREIAYQPRPDLVTPPDDNQLPAPQPSVARSDQWPESPEETRERLRQQAALSGTTSNARSPLARRDPITRESGSQNGPVGGVTPSNRALEAEQRARFREMRALGSASDPTRRNFLSEPPVDYRQPAETAAVGDFGESERAKESRRRRGAERGGRRWWPF